MVVIVTDILNKAINSWTQANPDAELDDSMSTQFHLMRLIRMQINIIHMRWHNWCIATLFSCYFELTKITTDL